MTKAELMEALKNLPDDTEIHISSDDESLYSVPAKFVQVDSD